MKKLVLATLLIFVPFVSYAAPLTQTQAESLINVVRSSPNESASAFTGLITAFSNITNAQANSLIGVVQSSPNAPATSFLNLLMSFTQGTSQVASTNTATPSTQTQTQSGGITCSGVYYTPCGSGPGTPVCLDNGSEAYCRPPQPLTAPVQIGPETLAPQFGQDQIAEKMGSLENQYQQAQQTTNDCYSAMNSAVMNGTGAIGSASEAQLLVLQTNAQSATCQIDNQKEEIIYNEMRILDGLAPLPLTPIQVPTYTPPVTCTIPSFQDIMNGITRITCQ